MPNWVANSLSVWGDNETLAELAKQLREPYETNFDNEPHKREGEFLLWNIIRPIDTRAYFQLDKPTKDEVEKPTLTPEEISARLNEAVANFDPQAVMEQFQEELATGQDWYHWNIREWGTKWEIDGATLEVDDENLHYEFQTAWSPPVSALDKLAEQYPTLAFGLRAIDENDLFALMGMWENGARVQVAEGDVNHKVRMDFHGHCWLCDDPDKDDPDLIQLRAEQGCDLASIEHLDFEPEEE